MDSSSCTEPQDPRVRRTRKLLQDALKSLLSEKEFSAITITDIAERAQVNRATFYAHFADKEELAVSKIHDGLREALIARFPELPAVTKENLIEMAAVIFEFMTGVHGNCPKGSTTREDAIGLMVQRSFQEMLAQWMSQRGAAKTLFPGYDRELVATLLAWSIYGAADNWSRSTNRRPARDVCRELVAMMQV